MKITTATRYTNRVSQTINQILKDLHYHFTLANKTLPSLHRCILNQTKLLILSGITARDYYDQGLYRPDLNDKAKQEFLGEFQKWRWFHSLNPKIYNIITDDKLIFLKYASAAGLPTPELLAVIGSDIPMVTENLVTTEDVISWLENERYENFFIKPLNGTRGFGCLSLGRRIEEQWEELPSQRPIKLQGILDHLERNRHIKKFIVQKRLEPHPILANLSPNVLHTLRLITLIEKDAKVILGTLRIGMGNTATDNLARGGLVSPIDLETGMLGEASYIRDGLVSRTDTHPVTKARIQGLQLPHWDETMAMVLQAARHFAFSTSLGWDIGLTPEGPVIIEANNMFDPTGIQRAHGRGLMSTEIGRVLTQRNALTHIGLGFRRG